MTTPASFSTTCCLWLDGMDSTTVVGGSLAAVSGWTDKSGKGNTPVASATTTIAYSKNTKLINWSGVAASGPADVLKFPTAAGRLGAQTGGGLTGTDFTMFTVLKPTNNSGFNVLLFTDSTASQGTQLLLGYTDTTSKLYMDFGFAGATGTTTAADSLAINCYKFQTGSKTTTLYQNGTSLSIAQSQTTTFNTIPATGLFLGGRSAWTAAFNGSVGEIIIYSSALSDSDRYIVEGYLAWKWALASSLPAGHPFKSVGPSGWYTLPTSISTQQTLNRNTTYMLVSNTTVTIDVPFTAAPSSDGLGVVIDGQGYRLTIASVPNYTGSMDTTLSGAIVKNMTIAATGTTTIGGAGSYMFKLNIQNAQVINCLNIAPVVGHPDTAVFFGAFPSNCVASNCGNTGALNNVPSSGVFGYGATRCLAVNCYNTAPLSSYSSGMYGSSASGSIASNCYNSGSATGDAFGAIFNRGYPGGVIGLNYISNCYSAKTDFFAVTNYTVLVNSSYNTTWVDSNAVQFLTGAPIPRSVLPGSSVGSVWYSSAANTPYTLYSQFPVSYIPGGTLTSPTQCNLAANTIYRLQGPLNVAGYNANATSSPFSVLGANIVFDGSGQTITVINTADARGIFNASLAVLNLSVNQVSSTLFVRYDPAPGWVFVNRVDGGFASNCTITSNALTPYCAGGIFGGNSSNSSTLNCTNYGKINPAGGGMVGYYSFNCVTSNCVSAAGGSSAMFGEACQSCTAINCVNTGPNVIPNYHGGIFGNGCASCTAINCINTCSILPADASTGGIFGFGPYNCVASNCYNTGTVGNVRGRAIAPWSAGLTVISNCYTTNGLIGGETGVTSNACSSDTDGVWRDATALASLNGGNGLVGGPATPITSYPASGTAWYSSAPNTPYFLVSFLNSTPCFLAGARILTPSGYRCVETLADYDEITTSDGRVVPIKVFKTKIAKTDEDTAPFVITKGSISRNVPDEDLHLSGGHVIQDAKGVWQIPAGLATHPGSGVYQHLPGRSVVYYHIECPNFFTDNLVANNCVVESFRNKQGASENSYEYDIELGGFVRVMEDEIKNSETIPAGESAV